MNPAEDATAHHQCKPIVEDDDEMIDQQIYECFRTHADERFMLSFKGAISQNVLVSLAGMVEQKITANSMPQSVIKNVFAITVELSQNVLHHSFSKSPGPDHDSRVGDGVVMISEDQATYRIMAGNLIGNGNVQRLQDCCRQLQGLDHAGLRTLYKKRRRSAVNSNLKMPGLGLIDIASRSDRPIELAITPVDGEKSFMVLAATVEKRSGHE